MESLERSRELVQRILEEYAAIPYANGDYERELVMDRQSDRLFVTNDFGFRRVPGLTLAILNAIIAAP